MSVTGKTAAWGPHNVRPQLAEDGKESSSLTDQAYQALRREVLTCALQPGADISEALLADRLQMSKTPVREALARLRAEGFVKAFPRRGYQIAPLTIPDFEELIDLRAIVEAAGAELAAERISEDELGRLAELANASYGAEIDANLPLFIAANREFHLAIASASHNRRLTELAFKMFDELERYFHHGSRARIINGYVEPDHHRIVAVLRSRDREAARQVMIAHNEATRRGLFEAISTSGRRAANLQIGD